MFYTISRSSLDCNALLMGKITHYNKIQHDGFCQSEKTSCYSFIWCHNNNYGNKFKDTGQRHLICILKNCKTKPPADDKINLLKLQSL